MSRFSGRSLILVLLGAGSMVAAFITFALAFGDGGVLGTMFGDGAIILVPVVVILAGALAAWLDPRLAGLIAVVGGAGAAVLITTLAFASSGERLSYAAIGIGLAAIGLSVGFVPTALILRYVNREPDRA